MTRILFLPGSGASPDFWKPVGALLPSSWPKEYLGWPGLGRQPPDPDVRGWDDLVRRVEARMEGPADLVAQSMGGVIAATLAVRQPQRVRRLVLTATSGGVDMAKFGAIDWRPGYRELFPNAAAWVTERPNPVFLPIEKVAAPTLLLWGDADAISPVAVGQHLAERMPNARLHVVAGGGHDVAQTHAAELASLIERHLA